VSSASPAPSLAPLVAGNSSGCALMYSRIFFASSEFHSRRRLRTAMPRIPVEQADLVIRWKASSRSRRFYDHPARPHEALDHAQEPREKHDEDNDKAHSPDGVVSEVGDRSVLE
jgi:hypothetical protein